MPAAARTSSARPRRLWWHGKPSARSPCCSPGITGDRDLTAALIVWKGRYPTAEELDALVRANLFEAAELRTERVRSLDGQVRQVTCDLPDQRGICRVGHLRVARDTQPHTPEDGAVYKVLSAPGKTEFLLPSGTVR